MTMKKLNVKKAKLYSQSCHNESIPQGESETTTQHRCSCHPKHCLQQGATSATFSQGLQTSDCSPAVIRSDHQAHAYQIGHADSNLISREVKPRKREKIGFFKSLRRRLSSFLSGRRKSDCGGNGHYLSDCPMQCSAGHIGDCQLQCSNGHVSDCQSRQCSIPNLTSSRLSDKIRLSHAHNNIERRAGCQSCDSLSCPHNAYLSPKFSEWHSNRNHYNLEASKEKSCCLSKDVSQFSPTSSLQCDDSIFEETTARIADLTINMKDDKACPPDFVCDLADCVEFEHAKEKLKIWSPKVWSLTQELLQLSKFGWYWGPISRNEAEEKLINQPDGAFLVRDSSDMRYLLSLSFRSYGCTFHTRIEIYNGLFSFYSQPYIEGYPSIVELIEKSVNKSISGIFYFTQSLGTGAQQFPVRLTKPISRYTQVRSLQYLCRFVIRQHTRFDRIQQLPLPSTLKSWIEESQY